MSRIVSYIYKNVQQYVHKRVYYKQWSKAELFTMLENHVYIVAKVYWWIRYTLAPKFEANVYFSPKLQTWRLMCTLSLNLEAKVNLYM